MLLASLIFSILYLKLVLTLLKDINMFFLHKLIYEKKKNMIQGQHPSIDQNLVFHSSTQVQSQN